MEKHFCIGSYIRVLTSGAIKSDRILGKVCEKVLLSCYPKGTKTVSYVDQNDNEVTYSIDNFNKITLSKQNLPPQIIEKVRAKNPKEIRDYFDLNIVPMLEENRKAKLVGAIIDIILNDNSIPDSTQLGSNYNITKEELKTRNRFRLAELLSDMFIYAIAKTDNTLHNDFTTSITKRYLEQFECDRDIQFYDLRKTNDPIQMPLTSKGKFYNVFRPVHSIALHRSYNNDLQIYCLKFDDFEFDYDSLLQFLSLNIGYYVYSRARIQRYEINDELPVLAYNAIDYMKQSLKNGLDRSGNELSELLLYLFLEQVLRAPKFMSKIEIIENSGIKTSISSGIHLLPFDNNTKDNQIILGASIIEGDMKKAIEHAFILAEKLKARKRDERKFIEANLFESVFTKGICDRLESAILPSESNNNKNAITAFGMFIGYSLSNVDKKDLSASEYQDKVYDHLKMDIMNNSQYIEELINRHNLQGYPIYIYLLPFTDADTDKKNLMNRLLQISGRTL